VASALLHISAAQQCHSSFKTVVPAVLQTSNVSDA
jgi:hypothetical protein